MYWCRAFKKTLIKKIRVKGGRKCTRKSRVKVGRAKIVLKCKKGNQTPVEYDPNENDDVTTITSGGGGGNSSRRPRPPKGPRIGGNPKPECKRKGKGRRRCRRSEGENPGPRGKVKTAKVKYVFDKKGNALPVWYVPYTVKSGPDKGKTKYLNFNQIKKLGGKKDAKKAFREAGYPLPPKKYPGRGKPARPLGGKKKSTSIAVKQNRKGEIKIVDTSKKARKLARKGIKSRVLDVIKPGDKDYGYYNKGGAQLFKYGATLVATQHRRATRKVTRRGRRKFEKRGFPVNKLPLKQGSIKRFTPTRPRRERKRSRPKPPSSPKPTPTVNKRRRLGGGYPRRPKLKSRPKAPPRPPSPPRSGGKSRRRGRRGRRSDFLLKTNIMIIRNALNKVIRM